MARIRSIKPEFWDDRKLAKRASRDARLLYIALWNLADEWGRLNGDPQWIKGQVFSYDDDLNADAIGKLLEELENPALGAVIAYEADGDPYLFLPKLAKHQRLEPEKVNNGRAGCPRRLPGRPVRAIRSRPRPRRHLPPASLSPAQTHPSAAQTHPGRTQTSPSRPQTHLRFFMLWVQVAGSRWRCRARPRASAARPQRPHDRPR